MEPGLVGLGGVDREPDEGDGQEAVDLVGVGDAGEGVGEPVGDPLGRLVGEGSAGEVGEEVDVAVDGLEPLGEVIHRRLRTSL